MIPFLSNPFLSLEVKFSLLEKAARCDFENSKALLNYAPSDVQEVHSRQKDGLSCYLEDRDIYRSVQWLVTNLSKDFIESDSRLMMEFGDGEFVSVVGSEAIINGRLEKVKVISTHYWKKTLFAC